MALGSTGLHGVISSHIGVYRVIMGLGRVTPVSVALQGLLGVGRRSPRAAPGALARH